MKQTVIQHHRQSGQAIVLIALLIVALIASLGLAIDGGGMFLMYRDVQNATDATALSAAYALCTGDNPAAAGAIAAEMNGFVDGVDGATVTIANPPTSGTYTGNTNYVQVEITSDKPAYFIQVVYDGPLTVSAATVSQCRENTDSARLPNAAVIALRQTCGSQEAIRFRGTSDTVIIGGLYVNQTCTSNDSIKTNGNSDTRVDGKVCSQGTINASPPFQDVSGNIHSDVEPLCNDFAPVTDPEPLGLGVLNVATLCPTNQPSLSSFLGGTAQPGNYTDFGINNKKKIVTLAPGIYCVNADIDWKGSIVGNPDGVFIYQYCTSCTITWNGQADVDINAMTTGDYAGIQIYSLSTNTSPGHKINGGAGIQLQGTVYSPYGHCDIVGGSDSQFIGQFICYTADLGGNADTLIQYITTPADENPPEYGITE